LKSLEQAIARPWMAWWAPSWKPAKARPTPRRWMSFCWGSYRA